MWIDPDQTPSSGPRNLEPRRGLFAAAAITPPLVTERRIAPGAKRPDPRRDALGPEAGFARKRNESKAASQTASTAVMKSKAMRAGELYDANGAPIGTVVTPPSGSSAERDALRVVPDRPSGATALKGIPTWGWVALAGLVAAGAYAAWSDDDAANDADDDVNDDVEEAA